MQVEHTLSFHNLEDLPTGDNAPENVNVIVEIPKGDGTSTSTTPNWVCSNSTVFSTRRSIIPPPTASFPEHTRQMATRWISS